jgi:tetratricopeptide (TPR) repeat protein
MGAPKKRRAAQPQPKLAAPGFSWRSRHGLAAVLLCAAALAAFSNSFNAGFVLDSKPILLQDPRIRQATAENIALIFQHTYWWPSGEAGLYRPFTTLSYLLNYAILGNRDDPAGYHWINFLLHAANVVLVYVLAARLFRRFWPAVFLAGLWALHPLLTESVTNIVGRADLLAATAVLGGLWIYLKSTEASGGRRLVWLAGLAVVSAAGFFSKESAVVVVCAIALLEFTWWSQRKQGRALVLASIALLPPLAAMLYQRSVVLGASPKADFPFTDNPIIGAGFWAGKLTALKVLAHYLWLTVWPVKLSADYSYSQIRIASGTVEDWVAWIVVAAAVAGVVSLYRAHRTAFFLACFAFVTLLPGSNLAFPTGTIMAERFMYLPSIGLLGCLVLGVYRAGERLGNRAFAPLLLALIGTGFAVRTWARNADWHDDVSLGIATVRSAPQSFKAHKILAVALMESDPGDAQLDREIGEARQSMALIDSLPGFRSDPAIYRLAANLYLRKGDGLRSHDSRGRLVNTPGSTQAYRSALAALQRSVTILQAIRRQNADDSRIAANSAPEFVNGETGRLLSVVYERLGDGERALDLAIQARQAEPLQPQMYRQLADVFLAGGQVQDAATALLEGMIVTQDMEIRRELLSLYQNGIDSQACAIVQGPNGPAINPSCALVHDHLCAIAADSIKVRLETGRRDIAEQLKHSFLHDYGCPAGPIDQVLPE